MASQDSGRYRRDIANPGPQSPGRREQSPAERGMFGVKIAQHAAELARQNPAQNPAQKAAMMAMTEAKFREDVERSKGILSKKPNETSVEAAREAGRAADIGIAKITPDTNFTQEMKEEAIIGTIEAGRRKGKREMDEYIKEEQKELKEYERKMAAGMLRDVGDDQFKEFLDISPSARDNLKESPEIAALRAMRRRQE